MVYIPKATTAIEAIFIIKSLRELFLYIPTKNPRLNSAGIVLRPNSSMTTAPQIGLPVLAEVTAKKYTSPHGRSPFRSPNI